MVLYPIVNLRELRVGARAYVEGLEDTMISAVGAYGVEAKVHNEPSSVDAVHWFQKIF